jgi:hypothetical protein
MPDEAQTDPGVLNRSHNQTGQGTASSSRRSSSTISLRPRINRSPSPSRGSRVPLTPEESPPFRSTRKRSAGVVEQEEKAIASAEASPAHTRSNSGDPAPHICLCQPDPKIPRPRNGRCKKTYVVEPHANQQQHSSSIDSIIKRTLLRRIQAFPTRRYLRSSVSGGKPYLKKKRASGRLLRKRRNSAISSSTHRIVINPSATAAATVYRPISLLARGPSVRSVVVERSQRHPRHSRPRLTPPSHQHQERLQLLQSPGLSRYFEI